MRTLNESDAKEASARPPSAYVTHLVYLAQGAVTVDVAAIEVRVMERCEKVLIRIPRAWASDACALKGRSLTATASQDSTPRQFMLL